MVSPALTEAASAVVVSPTVAQFTVMLVKTPAGEDAPEPSLVVVTVARLATAPPQVAVLVPEELCTLRGLPGTGEAARSMGPRVRVPVVIAHPACGEVSDQLSPALAGR